MGLGHARRQIAIAAALLEAATDTHVLLATSVDEVAGLGLPPNTDTLKLPGLRKVANADYSPRRLGISKAEMRNLRSALLLEAVKGFRPDVVLVDKHPFGAGGELELALQAAKSDGARLVLGLRDILDDPVVVKEEWEREQVQQRLCEFFDLVLIYGVREVFDTIRAYELSEAISARARYCGYVVNRANGAWRGEDDVHSDCLKASEGLSVLCTVGGGEDGFGLLKTFAEVCVEASWKGSVIAGPMLPQQQLHSLRQIAAKSSASVQPFIPCVSDLFGSANAIVSMGGYNTLLEALCEGVPTVCVPRVAPRSEQLMRALTFSKLGLLRVIAPHQLTPEALRNEILAALDTDRAELLRRAHKVLDFSGAEAAAQNILALAHQRLHSNGYRDQAGAYASAERNPVARS